jgi:tol-pal system protein YbgF
MSPSMPLRLRTPLAAALLAAGLTLGSAAHAGLFDDEEARKAIVDLRGRIAANDEATKARLAELAAAQAQAAEALVAIRRSLLELNNQIEQMRGELAKLRGNDEQFAREIADLQRRQKDVSQAVDDRLRKLEPMKVQLDGREFMAEADEKKAYEEAIALMRSGEFDKAIAAFGTFQKRFPLSGYDESVRFWLGNALYGVKNYKDALAAFRAFVTASPQHPRAPEAMLALANVQAEQKDVRGARKTIEDLVKAYPQSEAAQAGKERLASLK